MVAGLVRGFAITTHSPAKSNHKHCHYQSNHAHSEAKCIYGATLPRSVMAWQADKLKHKQRDSRY